MAGEEEVMVKTNFDFFCRQLPEIHQVSRVCFKASQTLSAWTRIFYPLVSLAYLN